MRGRFCAFIFPSEDCRGECGGDGDGYRAGSFDLCFVDPSAGKIDVLPLYVDDVGEAKSGVKGELDDGGIF